MKRINNLLEQSHAESTDPTAQLEPLLQSLSAQEQMRLPEALSTLAVERLYPIMGELGLPLSLQEHLLWGYFREKTSSTLMLSDELLAEILHQHRENKRVVVESLVITAIKEEQISLEQLHTIRCFFQQSELLSTKPFEKEALALVCREKVRSGAALDEEEIERLLEAEAFSTVRFALEENGVEERGLKAIKPPAKGEKNRKWKQALFNHAQQQIQKNTN